MVFRFGKLDSTFLFLFWIPRKESKRVTEGETEWVISLSARGCMNEGVRRMTREREIEGVNQYLSQRQGT